MVNLAASGAVVKALWAATVGADVWKHLGSPNHKAWLTQQVCRLLSAHDVAFRPGVSIAHGRTQRKRRLVWTVSLAEELGSTSAASIHPSSQHHLTNCRRACPELTSALNPEGWLVLSPTFDPQHFRCRKPHGMSGRSPEPC